MEIVCGGSRGERNDGVGWWWWVVVVGGGGGWCWWVRIMDIVSV